jgi:predicted acetyltransferase
VVFSSLTPFSHAFYRRFGYETACARNNITIPAAEFAGFKPQGEFVQIFPGDDTAALQEVHCAYIANLNHGICRDYWPHNRGWNIFTRNDPYATGIFLYLWQDEKGRPRAYLKYQDILKNDEHILSVQELAFTGRDALYGMLGIVSGLATQFKKFQWLMPVFIDPGDFVNSLWDADQRIIPRDMTRIINVPRALELMRRPGGEGSYVIEVEDGMIRANCGKYLVEFGAEGTRVSPTGRDAHISCDIPVLSQLVTGYRTLENAWQTRRGGLEIRGNRETLDRVFTLRPQHVTEYF